MRRLLWIVIIGCLALITLAHGTRKRTHHRNPFRYSIKVFPYAKYRIDVFYKQGGLCAEEVVAFKKKGHKGTVIALPGGYFDPPTRCNVDFTMVDFKRMVPYLPLHRPVLAFSETHVRIIHANKRGEILLHGEYSALAGDSIAIEPEKRYLRHIVTSTATAFVSIKCYGTYRECCGFLRQHYYSPKNSAFLDGDTTLLPGHKVPSWILCCSRT